MSDEDPITLWFAGLRNGEVTATEGLYRAFFSRLAQAARARMASLPRRSEDEEDVAQSVLNSFFRRAALGEFALIEGRDDLWRLLFTMTARKVVDRKRRHFAQKRPKPLDEAALASDDSHAVHTLDHVWAREPGPELEAEFVEEFEARIAALPNDEFRRIAMLKFEGFSNDEIADRLGTYTRKIERRLEIIRALWSRSDEDDDAAE